MDEINTTNNNHESSAKPGKKLIVPIAVLGIIAVLIAGIIIGIVFGGRLKTDNAPDGDETAVNAENPVSTEFMSKTASLFSNGLLSVYDGSKWGYIDEDGKLIIDCQFDYAGEFSKEGIAVVATGEKYGLIDRSGKYIVNPLYEEISSDFAEGYIAARKDGKYGFIDKNGKTVIDYTFDSVTGFRNGYSIVLSGSVYGVIDKDGNYVIDAQYDDMTFAYENKSSENVFLAKKNSSYGYINEKGDTVVDFTYDYIKAFAGSYCFIEDKYAVIGVGGNEGLISADGKYLIEAEFNQLDYIGEDIFAFTDEEGRKGFIGADGKEIAGAQFEDVSTLSCGCIRVAIEGYYGFTDTEGKYIINPSFSEARDFRNGFAVVKKDDKYSFIDTEGNTVTGYQFDYMSDFNMNGLAVVRIDNRYGVIDTEGEYVVKLQYYFYAEPETESVYDDYLCVMDVSKTVSIISPDGKEIARSFDGIAGRIVKVCEAEGCYELIAEEDNGFCYLHQISDTVFSGHQIDYSYSQDYMAYLRNPSARTPVYVSCGVPATGHWISGYEPVTIHEVYTDGCCKVSYITDSGAVKTYYADISDFGTGHVVSSYYGQNFTAYLKNPKAGAKVYTSCGVVASGHWISGYEPVTIHEVYTDGCCKVSYITDSGAVRTYYAKLYDFETQHVLAYGYSRNFVAYLKNPKGRTKVYTSCGVVASGHWISGYDHVIIHEVYSDGCCKVSYTTDSGAVKTYYAKISDFTTY